MNYEEIIPKIIDYNFKEVDFIGLKQRISVWNQIDEI